MRYGERPRSGVLEIGAQLSTQLGHPVCDLWDWRNGYALCMRLGLDLITDHLTAMGSQQADALASRLRIGIHRNVEVTDGLSF